MVHDEDNCPDCAAAALDEEDDLEQLEADEQFGFDDDDELGLPRY